MFVATLENITEDKYSCYRFLKAICKLIKVEQYKFSHSKLEHIRFLLLFFKVIFPFVLAFMNWE
jgi:hypothetical protein